MSKPDTTWWTLRQVVDWFQRIDPDTPVWKIRVALEGRCASARIRARGRQRIYSFDRSPAIGHTDPMFVSFSDGYSYVTPSPEPISTYDWHDLAFFARPIHEAREQYVRGFAQALDQLESPVELRSKSKHRLAWIDVEFDADDVMREWPHSGNAVEQDEIEPNPPPGFSGSAAGGTAAPGLSTRPIAPLPDRELRWWYGHRISELTALSETASGEADWEAAKQQFPGRVTRARMRAMREQFAPTHWKQQGRHSPLRGK